MCHPPAVVLHGRLIALAHSARSFALALVDTQFQSVPFLPRPKKTRGSTQLAVLIWRYGLLSEYQLYHLTSSYTAAVRLFSKGFVPWHERGGVVGET